MSVTVALITQPLRSLHCTRFLEAEDDGEALIVTSDPGAFDPELLRPGISIRPLRISDAPGSLSENLRGWARRRVISWSRGGSTIGARAEHLARRLLRPGAKASHTVVRTDDLPVGSELPNAAVLQVLMAIGEETVVSRIVVFDLFDLPAALEFAEETGIDVMVR